MKVISKIITVFILTYMLISTSCYANSIINDIVNDKENFENTGANLAGNITSNRDTFEPIIAIGQILTTVGVAVMLGATAYMGIKYLISNAETKGKLKSQLVGLVVSGVVIFGAYSIWKIVILIASNF